MRIAQLNGVNQWSGRTEGQEIEHTLYSSGGDVLGIFVCRPQVRDPIHVAA